MRRSILAALFALLLLPGLLSAVPASAAKPAKPAKITSVTTHPGPGVGQITLSWKSSGKNTTGFVLNTALSKFSKTSSATAGDGRRSRLTTFGRNQRSVVLSAAQVHALGAGIGSGNALFYRLYAVNKSNGKTSAKAYSKLKTMLPRSPAPKAKGTKLRISSFNVRTARKTGDKRSWSKRAPDVAREIVANKPGVVAIQELGPGRADGKKGAIKGAARQTESLETALARAGGAKYQLVRTTSYVAPGAAHATQGARILYDSSRYQLLTRCPEKTGKQNYSPACSMEMPKLSSDGETDRRSGALAEFKDRSTGKKFWVVSLHLDTRHSGNAAKEKKFEALRKRQVEFANARVAHFNTDRAPVFIGGDFNSWQNTKAGNNAHDRLIELGYYDASAAVTRTDFKYTTYNGFKVKLPKQKQKVGVRMDQMFVKGATGASYWENVMKVTDHARPSDHNMVLSDIVL